MWKSLIILFLLAILIALPFALRPAAKTSAWKSGDPVLVIVTPHNEATRYEFERAFSKWHLKHFGQPIKIDWRVPGGTTEITRYLVSEYSAAAQSWWTKTLGKPWPAAGADAIFKLQQDAEAKALFDAFRATDDADALTSRIDLFFGGGEFDHSSVYRQGMTVAPWKAGEEPAGLFSEEGSAEDKAEGRRQKAEVPNSSLSGRTQDANASSAESRTLNPEPWLVLIPEKVSGEVWRTPYLFGTALSTFGLCYNTDRLADLAKSRNRPDLKPPATWDDLADPVYFKQIGACDPSKSGSVAKAFEMIIHQKMHDTIVAAGYDDAKIAEYEKAISTYEKTSGPKYKRGDVPPEVPGAYQAAVERGWENGMRLVQRIGANARYFTDSAQKVPIDVSAGDAAVGMCIDFYGRFQAQSSAPGDGRPRMVFVTPRGGSSVSCDPISLLRGAGGGADSPEARKLRRTIALRFIQFTLSEEGQKVWCYQPTGAGASDAGGPEKFALRRVPIRRDFYPSTNPTFQARHLEHAKHSVDDLASPTIDPYQIAKTFVYYKRWTGDHFFIMRDLIRVMCMDAGDELKDAWGAIIAAGGPAQRPEAIKTMEEFPKVQLTPKKGGMPVDVAITWRTTPEITVLYDRLEYTRVWTAAFREQYQKAERTMHR